MGLINFLKYNEIKRMKGVYLTPSRPDIAYFVQSLSQFLHAPCIANFEAVKRVLRYLKHNSPHGLQFPAKNFLYFKGYSDSYWAGNILDRCSVGGYCFLLGFLVNSWRAKKKALRSRSSAKVECRALVDASCEVLWL